MSFLLCMTHSFGNPRLHYFADIDKKEWLLRRERIERLEDEHDIQLDQEEEEEEIQEHTEEEIVKLEPVENMGEALERTLR